MNFKVIFGKSVFGQKCVKSKKGHFTRVLEVFLKKWSGFTVVINKGFGG